MRIIIGMTIILFVIFGAIVFAVIKLLDLMEELNEINSDRG